MLQAWQRFCGAIAFYTIIPLPTSWVIAFEGIAGYAPFLGLSIGLGCFSLDYALQLATIPPLTRSVLVVTAWLLLTGGLHLDGVLDTADGLAVQGKPLEARLTAMSDSRTGAFGTLAAICLLLLKVAALTDITTDKALILPLAAGMGRWAQLVAIALYPYLKPDGKGAFHKAHPPSYGAILGTLGIVITYGVLFCTLLSFSWNIGIGLFLSSIVCALAVGAYFNWQLGGHTGDTYGATVEWTEALILCIGTVFFH